LVPADGGDELLGEEGFDGVGVGVGLCGDVRDDGDFGGVEGGVGEGFGEFFGGRLQEGGVEGAGDLEGDGAEALPGFG
jgi:hypothetical protein